MLAPQPLISPAHWDAIKTAARPYLGDDIRIALLGGSQVLPGLADQTADYDVLLVGARIDKQTSLILHTQEPGGLLKKTDLILRDAATITYNFEQDRREGRGTLLHICAYGVSLWPENRAFHNLKALATRLHTYGPLPVTWNSLGDHLDHLQRRIDSSAQLPIEPRVTDALLIAHSLGEAAQRSARQWVGKGKIMGRFMRATMPHVLGHINRGMTDLMLDADPTIYNDLARYIIPSLYVSAGDYHVPYKISDRGLPEPTDLATAFTNARRCPTKIARYLHSPDQIRHQGAEMWLRWKFNNLASPLTPDRVNRPGSEYALSLARYMKLMTDLHVFGKDIYQTGLNRTQVVVAMTDRYPFVPQAVRKALEGDPTRILQFGRQMMRSLDIDPDQNDGLARQSPACHRIHPPLFQV